MNYRLRVVVCFLAFLAGLTNVQGETRPKTEAKAKVPSFEEYIRKYKTLAIQHQKEYKIPASITLAQGLLESAAGDSYLAKIGNNHFGIKCKETWDGKRIYHTDDAPNECFRRYSSVEDSYKDHSVFLSTRKYYTSLFKLDMYDYKAWAYGLQKCGYATDKKYGEKLVRLIETYELYKYDKANFVDYIERSSPIIEEDEIYEIKIAEPKRSKPAVPNWQRKIYENNGVHYVVAQENDTYDMIAYDVQARTSTLLKYNEVPKGFRLNEGDIVYLQNKKKYADYQGEIHVVSGGESLHAISQIYGIKLKSLYKLNNLNDSYIPKAGDTLRVSK
ncbi:MAG: glucosaminidase domain-containing protein [Tannerella sp.]|jgi:LysM repeat protein|nr:glucosaminidase domain-containing protein [Tannerella sp.]